jgi:hypothetical protein
LSLGFGRAGVAASDYGSNGGDVLQRQVKDETEEEKLRRRLGLLPTQSGSALNLANGSPAMKALFGGLGGLGRTSREI